MKTRILLAFLFVPLLLMAQSRELIKTEEKKNLIGVDGSVADYVTRKPIPGALVEVLSSDSILLESLEAKGEYHDDGVVTKLANYFFVQKRGHKYILRVSFEGYETDYVTLDLTKTWKRELGTQAPTAYLMRSMTGKLDEITVTATKLKFYHKGDTLVYDASAFRLAEGSMLDALIEQLPGAELKKNGQILINGKKVDALLLNGKDFFNGNNQIMLDNLPNYMVNTINVYDKQSRQSEFLGYNIGDEQYVMDVRLKKQYSIGWLGNVEGGAGSKERYLGRLFASRFTTHSQVAFYGNINNLNDSRKPGQNGDWSPDDMKGGLLTTKMAGLNYAIDDRRGRFKLNGNAQFAQTDNNLNSYTNRTNFLPSGDTYDWQKNLSKNKDTRISTGHDFYFKSTGTDFSVAPSFNYHRYKNNYVYSSATFADELNGFSKEQLDSVFTPDFGKSLRNILINRNLQQGKGNGSEWNGNLQMGSNIKIKHTSDAISLSASMALKGGDAEKFEQNRVDYYQGGSAGETDFRNQYWDQNPGKGYNYKLKAGYTFNHISWPTWTFSYQYGQKYDTRTSSLFRLDQLDGWGSDRDREIGLLPSEELYKNTLDKANSYDSRQLDRTHEVGVFMVWNKWTDKYAWWSQIKLPVTFAKRKMHYKQGETDTIFTRKSVLMDVNSTFIEWKTLDKKHRISLFYYIQSQIPEMSYYVDVKNNADPLNITLGNPNLKDAYKHRYNISYRNINKEKQRTTNISLSHEIIQNAIAMGYNYDKQTGVRTIRPENVNGNWNATAQIGFWSPLDKKRKLNLSSILGGNYYHNVDLVSTNETTGNNRSTVKTFRLSETLKLDYQWKDGTIGVKANPVWSNSTGNREEFKTINALDLNYGLTAQWKLPLNIQFNTDITMYSRRGYEDSSMNTDDLVWNVRLSRPFFKNRILLTVDGFDVLGQVSNVTRILNAQGRVETYTNVIPRYFLCHLTYRLNVLPKKKK